MSQRVGRLSKDLSVFQERKRPTIDEFLEHDLYIPCTNIFLQLPYYAYY